MESLRLLLNRNENQILKIEPVIYHASKGMPVLKPLKKQIMFNECSSNDLNSSINKLFSELDSLQNEVDIGINSTSFGSPFHEDIDRGNFMGSGRFSTLFGYKRAENDRKLQSTEKMLNPAIRIERRLYKSPKDSSRSDTTSNPMSVQSEIIGDLKSKKKETEFNSKQPIKTLKPKTRQPYKQIHDEIKVFSVPGKRQVQGKSTCNKCSILQNPAKQQNYILPNSSLSYESHFNNLNDFSILRKNLVEVSDKLQWEHPVPLTGKTPKADSSNIPNDKQTDTKTESKASSSTRKDDETKIDSKTSKPPDSRRDSNASEHFESVSSFPIKNDSITKCFEKPMPIKHYINSSKSFNNNENKQKSTQSLDESMILNHTSQSIHSQAQNVGDAISELLVQSSKYGIKKPFVVQQSQAGRTKKSVSTEDNLSLHPLSHSKKEMRAEENFDPKINVEQISQTNCQPDIKIIVKSGIRATRNTANKDVNSKPIVNIRNTNTDNEQVLTKAKQCGWFSQEKNDDLIVWKPFPGGQPTSTESAKSVKSKETFVNKIYNILCRNTTQLKGNN